MSVKKQLRWISNRLYDPRTQCDVKIRLLDIIVLVVCSVMSGVTDISHMPAFGHSDFENLKRHFGIERIASERTLRRVLSLISPQELFMALLDLLLAQGLEPGDILACDGKSIRSTEQAKSTGLRIMNIYDTQNAMTIAMDAVGAKTNEIPVLQRLLKLLDIKGRVITADAMHCQKQTCAIVVEGEGDYVFQVKKSQGDLLEHIQHVMDTAIREQDPGLSQHESHDRGHGREERRLCHILPVVEDELAEAWSGLSLYVRVDRFVKSGKNERRESSYYISSLVGTAAHLQRVIREHWKVEAMHWQLDVTFLEDSSRVRDLTLQMNLSTLRKVALALHLNYIKRRLAAGDMTMKRRSAKMNMLYCMKDLDLLVEVLMEPAAEAVVSQSTKKR